uniref:Core Histone H2A/H2B/H3 domain-containing protein n=1 Tax=Anopheles quadriannulatus TaxID=34691 RepID=A0A182X3N8_ANOQN
MPRPKSAPRSLSEREEQKSKARTLRSQVQSGLLSSSDEEEDASQRNRRGASSASAQSSGTQNRSRSVETPRPTSTQSQSQSSQQADESRASRSVSRHHTPSSTSDEEEEDEEEHDPSQRNRRSRSSTRTPHAPEPVASSSQRRSVSAGPPGGGSTSQNVRPNRRPRIAPLLKEMLRLQLSWHHLIPKANFGRLVRELFDHRYRITPQALEALHEATEVFLVQLFEDAYKCCLHRARVTLAPKDIELVIILRRGIK